MDCSTWFLIEKQSKMTYPLPPRFFSCEVLLEWFLWGFGLVLCATFLRFVCWIFKVFLDLDVCWVGKRRIGAWVCWPFESCLCCQAFPAMIVVQLKSVNPLTFDDIDRTKSAGTLFPCVSTKLCRSQVSVM